MSYFLRYLLIINIFAFAIWGWDKRQARLRKFRISEKRFLWLSILGGRLGAIAGMQHFRHKTIKGKFLRWFWLIVAVWIIIWIVLLVS